MFVLVKRKLEFTLSHNVYRKIGMQAVLEARSSTNSTRAHATSKPEYKEPHHLRSTFRENGPTKILNKPLEIPT